MSRKPPYPMDQGKPRNKSHNVLAVGAMGWKAGTLGYSAPELQWNASMIEITLNKPFRLLSLVQTAYGVEELSSSEGPRFAAIGKEMTGRMV